jgi:hypothetical protein
MWKGNTPFEYEEDAAHSMGEEKRFRTIIPFNESSEIFVAFTIRDDRYRIISCRRQKIRNDILWETSICVPFCGDASDLIKHINDDTNTSYHNWSLMIP